MHPHRKTQKKEKSCFNVTSPTLWKIEKGKFGPYEQAHHFKWKLEPLQKMSTIQMGKFQLKKNAYSGDYQPFQKSLTILEIFPQR